MYTYKYAVGRYKDYSPGYHIVDIVDYSVADLEKLFDILYIVVNDGMFNVDSCIKLEDYRNEFISNPTLNIVEWLETKRNDNLVSYSNYPKNIKKFVRVERMFTYGLFHYPADLNLANDRQEALTSDAAPDIRVAHYNRTDIKYTDINSNTLFLVNGVFVRSVSRDNGIYLMGAGLDYIKNRKDLRIGAFNFELLGKVKTIPITESNLIEADTTNGKTWRVKTTEQLNNKTVWVVINGHLMVDDDTVHSINDDTVGLNLDSFDVPNHFLNYKNYTRTPVLTNLTKFDKYKRDALLMHNSFIVLVDNPSVGIELTPLTTFSFPNIMHTEDKFQHPLLLENGMFPTPYMLSYGRGDRLLNHDIRVYKRYPFKTSGAMGGKILNEGLNPGVPGRLPRGFAFKIFGIPFEK